ncbi:GNAT family N-acetyltransferase [Streptacidiphilus jiangxiensis]|uniref:Ribosomal protein S18 acetylase RimI n=1 Tax=Streptacidiphilus jiangxiensis TaxID=235985 RepID=A0A1H7KWQ1_STRJI|nr:GNAT family N-acetyltransferase [Streptacidiphilus jiangxiensis]SEK90926.1 Ribosomal protein S18 acetylase RimI [Streptacidiphilus jiangxiensis]
MTYRIHRVQPEDWERVRDIRLRMTKDTPLAYLESHEDALAHGEDEWRFRAARNTQPGNTGYAAVVVETGEWVGCMNSYVPAPDPGEAPDRAWLVGVWVDPAHRGRAHGLTDVLLDACLAWAREEAGVPELYLEVHERNERARAFYERRGFVGTGHTQPYDLDPTTLELEMKLTLRDA